MDVQKSAYCFQRETASGLFSLFPQSIAQKRGQGGVQRLAGAQLNVVGLIPRATQADFLKILVEGRQISFP
jgi:hypothetical protein